MNELKPCMCGWKLVEVGETYVTNDEYEKAKYSIVCENCGSGTAPYDTKEEVVKFWQTRLLEDRLHDEIDKMADMAMINSGTISILRERVKEWQRKYFTVIRRRDE